MSILHAVEQNSTHPVAKALMNFCLGKSDHAATVQEVFEVLGMGMTAVVRSGKEIDLEVVIGNEALLLGRDVVIDLEVSTILEH